MSDTDIQTAEEFSRELDRKQLQNEHKQAALEINNRHYQRLARIWAPTVAAIILGLFVMIAVVVAEVQSSDRARVRAHAHLREQQVEVWCFADPNVNRATSEFVGSRDYVKGLCPDARA